MPLCKIIGILFIVFHAGCCYYINCVCNPFFYSLFSYRYRKGFKNLTKGMLKCQAPDPHNNSSSAPLFPYRPGVGVAGAGSNGLAAHEIPLGEVFEPGIITNNRRDDIQVVYNGDENVTITTNLSSNKLNRSRPGSKEWHCWSKIVWSLQVYRFFRQQNPQSLTFFTRIHC